jgi:membrane-associated protein
MDFMQFAEMVLHFDRYLGAVSAQYGYLVYALMFAIVFLEMGIIPLFFLPGDPLLFIGGAFCATGAMNIWLLMALLFVAAVSGSTLNYAIGSTLGHKVFARDYRWLNRAALQRTHTFYENHGGVTFIMSPFIAVVRTFAPFIAGVSDMTFAKFMFFNIAGAAIWVSSLVAGGYFFGNIPFIQQHLNAIVLIGIGAGVGSLMVAGLWKILKKSNATTADVAGKH